MEGTKGRVDVGVGGGDMCGENMRGRVMSHGGHKQEHVTALGCKGSAAGPATCLSFHCERGWPHLVFYGPGQSEAKEMQPSQ